MGTQTLYPNATSAAPPGGQVSLLVVFETYNGSGITTSASDVSITITAAGTPDGGSGVPVPTTSAGIAQSQAGSYTYVWSVDPGQTPGSYLATWSGVRANDGVTVTFTQAVTVAALPSPVPVPGVFATVGQYQAWSGDTVTPALLVSTKLMRASEDIESALIGAVYATDADGMPTDPGLLSVLVRATCAQAQYLIANNDDSGVKREYSSTNVGGVSVSRAQSTQALALPPLSTRALQILHVAGVLPAAPLVNW